MIKSLERLYERSTRRPAGYLQDVLAHATNITATHYEIADEVFEALKRKYRSAKPKRRRGLGDIIAAAINVVTFGYGRRLADAIARAIGKTGCGCSQRQDSLNRLGSYIAGKWSNVFARMRRRQARPTPR